MFCIFFDDWKGTPEACLHDCPIMQRFAMGWSGMQQQQSDLHVSALLLCSITLHVSNYKVYVYPLLPDCFSKISTMGIKGVLAADIGQLTELQSLYVAAEHTVQD
jgi:hypothetical protein